MTARPVNRVDLLGLALLAVALWVLAGLLWRAVLK